MEKFPFTQQGLTDLLNTLFAQSDQELQLEADTLKNDFRSWTRDHFILSSSQLNFLDRIDNRFITIAATESSSFFSQRKLIQLVKSERPTQITAGEDPDEGKLLDLDKKETASYAANGEFSESQELTFTISYT